MDYIKPHIIHFIVCQEIFVDDGYPVGHSHPNAQPAVIFLEFFLHNNQAPNHQAFFYNAHVIIAFILRIVLIPPIQKNPGIKFLKILPPKPF
jgi:hypothetical protein